MRGFPSSVSPARKAATLVEERARDAHDGSQLASGTNHVLTRTIEWTRALSVAERLQRRQHQQEGRLEFDPQLASSRLAGWREQTTLGGEPLDLPTLHACTEQSLRLILGEPHIAGNGLPAGGVPPTADSSPVPTWLTDLESLHMPCVDSDCRSSSIDEAGFLAAIDRPIRTAKKRLRSRVNDVLERHPNTPIEPESIAEIMFSSVKRLLALLVEQTAVLEMHAARMEGRLSGETTHDRYTNYLQSFSDPEVGLRLLHQYPVLARLTATVLGHWVDSSAEFIERLARDWDPLRRAFELGGQRDFLTSLEALGDSHCGGRRVSVCTFESGFRLVYKPRSVRNELLFQNLLRWVNDRSNLPPLRTLTVVDRGDYGWVEYVNARHCSSVAELRRFYRRQGQFLAILHTLAANDFHYENVIASGEQPIMVDLEAILQPAFGGNFADFASAERVAAELASESVLRIGLLPARRAARGDHDGPDLSGLGAVPGQLTAMRLPRWANEGTDLVHQILTEGNLGDIHSRPIPPTINLTVADFAEDVVQGFETTYDVFHRSRRALLTSAGPMAAFARTETRLILRPTVAYAMLMRSCFHPQFLGDGLSRDLQFDRLLGEAPNGVESSLADVVASEREDLWQLDVPRFTTRANSRDLWTSSGKRIPNCVAESGLDAVRRRLARMSPEERSLQSWMIRTSIATNAFADVHGRTRSGTPAVAYPRISTADGCLAAAVRIGDRLARLAVVEGDTAMWFGLVSERAERWWISPVGPALYEGIAGIALFLAHLGSVASERRYVELARAALRTLRKQVARGAHDQSIGGFAGLGGHAYVLSQLAVLLDDNSLLAEADATVEAISPLVDDDTGLDVIAGSAGCIGALLAFHALRPADVTLDVAVRCGERLLSSAVETPHGLGFPFGEFSSRPLGGFAHGAAGMAWALLELAGATGEVRFREAAVEAIRYDRSLFSAAASNWLDVRENLPPDGLSFPREEGTSLTYWCHGAVGIGLSRIRCRRHWNDELVEQEIATAVGATIAHGFGSTHCLCHGDLGSLELLTEAHHDSPRAVSKTQIDELLREALCSIEERGCISGHVLGIESPGLMMGIAGVGYGLLRQEAPDRVPSVLLLDPLTA